MNYQPATPYNPDTSPSQLSLVDSVKLRAGRKALGNQPGVDLEKLHQSEILSAGKRRLVRRALATAALTAVAAVPSAVLLGRTIDSGIAVQERAPQPGQVVAGQEQPEQAGVVNTHLDQSGNIQPIPEK